MGHRQIVLKPEQVKALAELQERHVGSAHIYQSENDIVEVEFEFPFRYIIASNGRAIRQNV